LLEGLGFYASSGDVEMASEADEVPSEKPEYKTMIETDSITTTSSTAASMSAGCLPVPT